MAKSVRKRRFRLCHKLTVAQRNKLIKNTVLEGLKLRTNRELIEIIDLTILIIIYFDETISDLKWGKSYPCWILMFQTSFYVGSSKFFVTYM